MYSKVGVEAAKKLMEDDFIAGRNLKDITVEEVDASCEKFES